MTTSRSTDLRRPSAGYVRSRYTYDRSLIRDVADTLAAERMHCTFNWQLQQLDHLLSALADTFAEHDDSFDVEEFCTRAKFRTGLAPSTKGTSCPINSSPSSAT